jgi:hypothetical protein
MPNSWLSGRCGRVAVDMVSKEARGGQTISATWPAL